MIIYKITNIINNKVYIGLTTRKLNERKREHKTDASIKHFDLPLHRAIRKYGFENFKWEAIDHADSIDRLNLKEIYWIKFYNSTDKKYGYNHKEGGSNGKHLPEAIEKIKKAGRNRICKESTREKLRKNKPPSHKGKPKSEEHKRKISEAQKGRKKSPEQIEKMRKAMKGRKHSEETKKKMSEAKKGKSKPPEIMKNLRLKNIGSKRSEESRKKMSEAAKKRYDRIKRLSTRVIYKSS